MPQIAHALFRNDDRVLDEDRGILPPGTQAPVPGAREDTKRFYLTESVYKVVLQKSISTQICQLILYYH